jgi:hypothetical protein
VSLADPDARPIRKGKLGKPNLCRYRGYAEAPPAVAVIALPVKHSPSSNRSSNPTPRTAVPITRRGRFVPAQALTEFFRGK